MGPNQLNDQQIASMVLSLHKSGAVCKMAACLECAVPNLRRLIQQSATNCAEQAYETWQYMNQKGYYQVPTMKDMTTNTFINAYGTAGTGMEQGASSIQQHTASVGHQEQLGNQDLMYQ
jgi:spore coat protein CotF